MDTFKNVKNKVRSRHGNEGATTETIEKVTAGIPSAAWLILAGGTIAGALTLKLMGRDQTANFVGEWVPTILLLGLYNKIVKVLGSDRQEAFAKA